MHVVLLSVFGGIGCALRVTVRDAARRRGHAPWSTICMINLFGSAAIGMVLAMAKVRGDGSPHAVSAAVGVLAGWTTYSAFAMDVVQLWLRGDRARAAVIWMATMFGSPMLAWAGAWAVRASLGGGS